MVGWKASEIKEMRDRNGMDGGSIGVITLGYSGGKSYYFSSSHVWM